MVLVWLRLCISGRETTYSEADWRENNAIQCTCGKTNGLNQNTKDGQNGNPHLSTGADGGAGHYANLLYSSGFDITGCKKSGMVLQGLSASPNVPQDSIRNISYHLYPAPCGPKMGLVNGCPTNLTDSQSKFHRVSFSNAEVARWRWCVTNLHNVT